MILLIDNYDSFTYNLYQILCQFHSDLQVVRNDQIDIETIKSLKPAGIVISPGPGRPEDAGLCVEIIRQFSGKLPILGVCLGHQAIAIAFGGAVVRAQEILHGQASQVFHNRSTLYQNMSLPFLAGRYHSLVVEKKNLPPELKVEAETADEIVMGIRHVIHPTFGLQFHPESILSETGKNIIENFVSLCEREVC